MRQAFWGTKRDLNSREPFPRIFEYHLGDLPKFEVVMLQESVCSAGPPM